MPISHLIRNRKASKIAKKRLKTAEKHLHSNQRGPFYDELLNALYGYLSDKLGFPWLNFQLRKPLSNFRSKGTDESLVRSITALIDRCQYARYAPSGEEGTLKEDYEAAAEIIGKLEQTLR